MKRSFGVKVLGCTMGATMVLGGIGSMMPNTALAGSSDKEEGPIDVWQRAAVDYDKVANVQGGFTFTQDTLTPADEVFNLFGTATTTICAKPGYAFDEVTHEDYYVNVGGVVDKVYSIGLDEIERMEAERKDMRCTCGMSPAVAMATAGLMPHVQRMSLRSASMRSISSRPMEYTLSTTPPTLT